MSDVIEPQDEKRRNDKGQFKRNVPPAPRDEKGHFIKGHSGNVKGRPKGTTNSKKKAPNGTKAAQFAGDLPKDFHERTQGNPLKMFAALAETVTTRYEAFTVAKEYAQYMQGKKSSIESHNTEIKTIEVKWITDSTAPPVTIEGEFDEEEKEISKTPDET